MKHLPGILLMVLDAVVAARLHLRRTRTPQAVEILLAPGEYLVDKPLCLTRPDSGMQSRPAVVRAFPQVG
jgi:hypothetical protein